MAKSASPLLDADSRRWTLTTAAACVLPLLLQLTPLLSALIAVCGVAIALLAWRRPLHFLVRALLALVLIGAVMMQMNFGLGRDTGCALLAAMLAIKPAETSTLRDARSLIGFALFAPFGTFLLDQGPLSLVLGLIAALLALATLQRLAEFESGERVRRLGHWQRLSGIARLIAIGLPLALAAFWLFPRLGTPLWGVPDRSLSRPGLSGSMTPGGWAELMNDETPTLRVRFNGAVPKPSQMYWRGPVLWDFDGREWTQPRWYRGLPAAQTQSGDARWDYEIELEPTDGRQLVALDLPLAPPPDVRLSIDHGLFTARPLTALSRWRLRSAPPLRYQPQLQSVLRQAALDLPEGYNPRTLALAQRWRRELGGNDAALVQRALDWVHREFAYTLDTPLPGRHAVDEFLFDYKAGYCEHFSSSFVVLMRSAGIPARVVTGYAGGYRNPIGDYWLVRRSDAHAWAEVWLPQRGWVRVDPTAAVAPERVYDTLADRAPGANLLGGLTVVTPIFNLGDWARRGWNDFVLGFDANRQQNLLRPLGIDRLDTGRLVALFGVAAGLTLLWMVWLSSRGERERDPVLRAWHALGRRYRRLDLAREPHEPAGDWSDRVARSRPDLGPALAALSQRFADWRYAVAETGRRDAREKRELIRALRAHRPGPNGEGR